jgi:hypothetical protein
VSCSFADLPACFPAPLKYLADYKRANKQVSQWIDSNVVEPTVSPVFDHPILIRAINAIREVQVILQSETLKKDISDDVYFPANHTLPIFHDLLSMLDHDRTVLQEGFRLAAMLFVHELQLMYWGLIPPPLFLSKLHSLISYSNLDWSSQDPILFWILAVALSSDIATPEQKGCFLGKFKLLIRANNITNFNCVMRKLVQISWDYGILKIRTEILCSLFEENFK